MAKYLASQALLPYACNESVIPGSDYFFTFCNAQCNVVCNVILGFQSSPVQSSD